MASTYLITGGAGFIGRQLSTELLSYGHSVRVIDSLIPQYMATPTPRSPGLISMKETSGTPIWWIGPWQERTASFIWQPRWVSVKACTRSHAMLAVMTLGLRYYWSGSRTIPLRGWSSRLR